VSASSISSVSFDTTGTPRFGVCGRSTPTLDARPS
jgi:hypothetical protein